MLNAEYSVEGHAAALYDSENFTVVAVCNEAHTETVMVMVIDQRTEPPKVANLSGPLLQAFTWRTLLWQANVPEQHEVEEVLAGYALGAATPATH